MTKSMAARIKEFRFREHSVFPHFGLGMGITLAYLSLVVLIPISGLFFNISHLNFHEFWAMATDPRALASYRLTFGASVAAAIVNALFGLILAWVLVRYNFFGKKIIDAAIDLPFALPTAVAGIALAALYSKDGFIGSILGKLNITVAFTPLGVFITLVFVGLPFVVRTIEPILQDLDREVEEAAACLGASRRQIITKVLLPQLFPATLTGFALAFARGLGEYGSVIFIAGNIPMVSEIVPLIIIIKLEQYDYTGATVIAVVMLIASFILLLIINLLQKWTGRHDRI